MLRNIFPPYKQQRHEEATRERVAPQYLKAKTAVAYEKFELNHLTCIFLPFWEEDKVKKLQH